MFLSYHTVFESNNSDPILMTSFVKIPVPYGIVQMCRILRSKESFELFLDGTSLTSELCFLTARKNNKVKLYTEYQIFLKASDRIIAIVRSNFWGTVFEISSVSLSRKDTSINLGCVLYRSNFFGVKGPRQMRVLFPSIQNESPSTCSADYKYPTHSSSFNIETSIEYNINTRSYSKYLYHTALDPTFYRLYYKNLTKNNNFILLKNKQPIWSDEHQSHVLNFHGRVSHPSVKNFQLIHPSEESYIVMQFGRIGKDMFVMDIKYPMSLLQAFSIVLSSFAFKIACE